MKVQISFTWEGTPREYEDMLTAFGRFSGMTPRPEDNFSDSDVEEAIDGLVVVDLTRLPN